MATSKTVNAPKAKSAANKASTKKDQLGLSEKKNKLDPSEIPTYTHLRLIIDGFQTFALHHFTRGKDAADRKKRAREVVNVVSSFQKQVMKANKMAFCPGGMCSCDGTCIDCGVICPQDIYS